MDMLGTCRRLGRRCDFRNGESGEERLRGVKEQPRKDELMNALNIVDGFDCYLKMYLSRIGQ